MEYRRIQLFNIYIYSIEATESDKELFLDHNIDSNVGDGVIAGIIKEPDVTALLEDFSHYLISIYDGDLILTKLPTGDTECQH